MHFRLLKLTVHCLLGKAFRPKILLTRVYALAAQNLLLGVLKLGSKVLFLAQIAAKIRAASLLACLR
jgi:hypothetical protein